MYDQGNTPRRRAQRNGQNGGFDGQSAAYAQGGYTPQQAPYQGGGFDASSAAYAQSGYRPPEQAPNAYAPPNGAYATQANWYTPPPQPKKASGRGKPGVTPPPPKKKRSLKWQLIKLLLLLALIGGACAGLFVWKTQSEVRPHLNVFAPNVSVDGIDLSGKTFDEGSRLVQEQLRQKQNSWYVRLKNAAGEYKDITAQTLGIAFDPTAALTNAWAVAHDVGNGRRKDIFALHDEIEQAKATQHAFSSARGTADTTPIDSILQTLENAAYRSAQDAYLVSFNPDDEKNPFTIQPEVWGQRLNTTAVREQIMAMVTNLESGEIMLTPEAIAPNVTAADIAKTVALRSRAVTPIASNSSKDRTENIRIAFSRINGMAIPDGKKFSFNSTVGRRSLENGFLPAIEYAYGVETYGIGGGSCQASTTIYVAAAESGLTVTHREPHSKEVSYTSLGLDATVNDMRGHEIDLTFRNNSGGTIYIAAHVIKSPTNKKNLLCEVRIYGPSLGNLSYRLVPQTVKVIPKPGTPILKDDKANDYNLKLGETKTIKGRDGYVVDTYLVTYMDGAEIERKKVTTDTYPEKADTIYTGVTAEEVY